MLEELGLVEQRYQAVLEVVNQGVSVTEVAATFGVTRQTVHRWLRRYAAEGLGGLVDGSAKPLSCPHQMLPGVEARIVELRRERPGWGPRTIRFRLEAERVSPLPGRSSIYRCLVRHGLIEPEARRRKKADYKRWERSRAMELWQMDVIGGVRIVDGVKASIVSGVDDHSRFVISARVVERATARPVCDALVWSMRTHGVPQEVLTDNGKVFTGRFGPGTGEVLFDRICRENGVKHILTAPRSPTTTGKVERWHKTLRREFLNGRVFESIADAQEQLDQWPSGFNGARMRKNDEQHRPRLGRAPWSRTAETTSWMQCHPQPAMRGCFSPAWATRSRTAGTEQGCATQNAGSRRGNDAHGSATLSFGARRRSRAPQEPWPLRTPARGAARTTGGRVTLRHSVRTTPVGPSS